MSVKLTLDASALQYLMEHLGEDFVLQIKQAVLEETARRTIHSVATNEVKRAMEEVARDELKKVMEPVTKSSGYWNKPIWSLKEEFRKLLTSQVKSEINEIVDDKVKEAALEKMIADRVQAWADHIEVLIDRKLNENLNEKVVMNLLTRKMNDIIKDFEGSIVQRQE